MSEDDLRAERLRAGVHYVHLCSVHGLLRPPRPDITPLLRRMVAEAELRALNFDGFRGFGFDDTPAPSADKARHP